MYIKKKLIFLGLVFLFNMNLFSMDRVAQNNHALLEKWRGQEKNVEKIIEKAKKTGKSQQLTIGEENELQATFLPYQKQVVLFGRYEIIQVSFAYFLQQIQVLSEKK